MTGQQVRFHVSARRVKKKNGLSFKSLSEKNILGGESHKSRFVLKKGGKT